MNKAKSVLGVLLIYGLLNLILWGGQELYYRDDTKEINRIEYFLELEEIEIKSLEKKIETQSFELDQRKVELDNFERQNFIDSYNSHVGAYNLLLATYKNNLDNYDYKLTQYNDKINKVNELIKKSGSRWYLIPIPMLSKSTKTKL